MDDEIPAAELVKYRNHLAKLRRSEARKLYGSSAPTNEALQRLAALHNAVAALDAVIEEGDQPSTDTAA